MPLSDSRRFIAFAEIHSALAHKAKRKNWKVLWAALERREKCVGAQLARLCAGLSGKKSKVSWAAHHMRAIERASETPAGVAFGRLLVSPHRRELLAHGRPIKLGGRAFDMLMALIEARGEVAERRSNAGASLRRLEASSSRRLSRARSLHR